MFTKQGNYVHKVQIKMVVCYPRYVTAAKIRIPSKNPIVRIIICDFGSTAAIPGNEQTV
jgi:hypothetical protein